MFTVTAAVLIDHQRLTGFMTAETADGQFYQRSIDIPILVDHRHLENPPYVASMLIVGVSELATLAQGRNPAHHGWAMPYRKDGLMVFEFDIDESVCEHGFDLNGRCPVEA